MPGCHLGRTGCLSKQQENKHIPLVSQSHAMSISLLRTQIWVARAFINISARPFDHSDW